MERREQYDPEDIENLLQERSFDELLEEERAYVLRHLSGRDEYEKMRSLLLHVREDDRMHQPIVAEERVRENVMQAFRAQQQPQWRVWLNTVGGLFQPSEGFAMWRPALALGMLVVLFGIGFYLVRGPLAGPSQQDLAEVRRQKAEEPLPVKRTEASDTITNSLTSTREESSTEIQEVKEESGDDITSAKPVAPPSPLDLGTIEKDGFLSAVPEERMDMEVTEPLADQVQFEESAEDNAEATPTFSSPHVVTEAEMMRNQSLANASGQVQPRALKERESKIAVRQEADEKMVAAAISRPVSQDPALLDLLSAGW